MDIAAPVEFHKPKLYILSHVFLGFAAAFWYPVIILFHIYQLGQLALNVRFFAATWEVKPHNTWRHTLRKLLEFFLGFSAGISIRRLNEIN